MRVPDKASICDKAAFARARYRPASEWPRTIIIVYSGKSRPAAGARDDVTMFLPKLFGEDEMASLAGASSA